MQPDPLNVLLDILTQFTGGRGGIDNIVVNYGIAGLFYAVLFAVARTNYRHDAQPREYLLQWGFGFGLSRELFMLCLAVIRALGWVDPVRLHSVFPPLEHLLLDNAMIFIAGGYLRYFAVNPGIAHRYLRFGITSTLLAYLATFWWWAGYIEANPASKFGKVWCDWLFHVNGSFWLLLATIYIFRGAPLSTRNLVTLALFLFAVSDFLKLPDMFLHEAYEYVFTPIARIHYLVGIFILGYVYFHENDLRRKQMEQQLSVAAKAFESQEGIVIADADGVVLRVNQAFSRITGHRPEEVIGQKSSILKLEGKEEEVLPAMRSALGLAKFWQGELWDKRKNGEDYPIWLTVNTVAGANGLVTNYVAAFTDISLNKAVQEAKESAAVLTEQTRLLRESDLRKNEFLAMLAHELRNPLAPIRNAAKILIQGGADSARIAWCGNIIERQIEHLVRLVDDLLDVSRISQGMIELNKEPQEIRDFVMPAVETNQPLLNERRQDFHLEMPPEPIWVEGDRIRLAQIVSNLLNNAVKYTQVGGRVDLTVAQDAESVQIRLRDNGRGIDADDINKLFDMFYQADHKLDRSQGGLGIGLSIVRKLAAMHGGDVRAFSAGRGQGSEFIISLPRLIPPGTAYIARGKSSTDQSRRKLRILLVDDNCDATESLATLLTLEGHQVLTCHDGHSALEIAEAGPLDAILLDIGLPGMDGYTLARELRRRQAFKETLMVAITGYGRSEDRERALAAGFDEHMVKPMEFAVLKKLFRRAN